MVRLRRLASTALLFVCVAYALGCNKTDVCPSDNLPDQKHGDLECQFTLGRIAFRKDDYKKAAAYWTAVVGAKPKDEREKIIVAVAHGTLGYLSYYGKGVKEDRKHALDLYNTAVRLGDLESRQHLGFAFSDETNEFYDPVTAYAWYRSVEHHYKPILDEEADKRILQIAREEMAKLKGQLSDNELRAAEEKSFVIDRGL